MWIFTIIAVIRVFMRFYKKSEEVMVDAVSFCGFLHVFSTFLKLVWVPIGSYRFISLLWLCSVVSGGCVAVEIGGCSRTEEQGLLL